MQVDVPTVRSTTLDFLIRFVQTHETFRKAETDALAALCGLQIEWLSYSNESPFAIIRFSNCKDHDAAARALVARSILSIAIHELWGKGPDYAHLYDDIRTRTQHLWEKYRKPSFRFEVDSFHGSRSLEEQRGLMETLGFMRFEGPIIMKQAQNHFTIFEDSHLNAPAPHRLFFGRLVAESGRKAIATYNLKKRRYISTTSMDAELSLITANLALAGPGKLAYDPFMGTGSFPVACAHFGAAVFGSDMDGRSIRGKKGRSVRANFEQYRTTSLYLDGFAADLTNTPLCMRRHLDAIVCDPPYGVREGLKVLGSFKPALQREVVLANGLPAHLADGYVPPRRPYSFLRMLDDILCFGSSVLVDEGRLCMWMPVAGALDDDGDDEPAVEAEAAASEMQTEYAIPQHPALELVSTCTQDFNKWSRRLLTYRRRHDDEVDSESLVAYELQRSQIDDAGDKGKSSADQLNAFRRKYFQGFREPS